MKFFSKLTSTQFKNYSFSTFNFNERVVGICGLNGKGKTNLLDAIYYLCFTKSYFSKTDVLNVQFTADGFRIEGEITAAISPKGEITEKPDSIVCIFRGTGKKDFFLNDVEYSKFSEHIGLFPCVMVAPDDIELVTGASEERRRYLDTLISQLDAAYLQNLIVYTKVLQQRNSLLKRFAEQGKKDLTLLETLDELLLQPAKYLHDKRIKYSAQLTELIRQFYKRIAGNDETITMQYESQLNNAAFNNLLLQNREKDFLLQRTSAGLHKDDLSIQLNGQVFKLFASQGQRKSLLFAMKLAEFELLKTSKGFPPVLLLDDVFEKLDDNRMNHLLHWVCKENNGQVFITDTHKDRLEQAFEQLDINFQIISL